MQAYEATGSSDEEIKKRMHQVSTPGQRAGFTGGLKAESLSTRTETKNLPVMLCGSPPTHTHTKSVSFKLGNAHEKGYFMGEVFLMCNNLYP